MADETTPQKPNASGGCSVGCAGLFVVAGLAWPVLHFLGGHVESEAMFVPVVVGAPAFLVAHILAIIAIRSRSAETAARGRTALRIIWIGFAVVAMLGFLAWLADVVRGRL